MSKQALTFRNNFTAMVKTRLSVKHKSSGRQFNKFTYVPHHRCYVMSHGISMAAKYKGLKSTPLNKKHYSLVINSPSYSHSPIFVMNARLEGYLLKANL